MGSLGYIASEPTWPSSPKHFIRHFAHRRYRKLVQRLWNDTCRKGLVVRM